MPKTYLNSEALFPSRQYGFSQIVVSTGGATVYISGQVAWDANRQIGDHDDLGTQTRRALANVETAVRAAGGTRGDIVAMRIYIVGDQIRDDRPVQEALLEFFPADRLPASTWIGVPALANPDFLVEIEATAVIEAQAEITSQSPAQLP
jgi:2-iminobutanoate/2-iminopropanoate deaminase